MEYSFTDWDCREYKRHTDKGLIVSSQPISLTELSLVLSDSKKEIIKLVLTQKEAKALSLAIEAAMNDLQSKFEMTTK